MWVFQVNYLSMCSPKNLVVSTWHKLLSSILIWLGRTLKELLNNITFVFSILRDNLLAWIHDWTSLSSLFIILISVCGSRCEKNTFESSAKQMNERICDEFWRSLIYKINKSGPNINFWHLILIRSTKICKCSDYCYANGRKIKLQQTHDMPLSLYRVAPQKTEQSIFSGLCPDQ